MQRSLQRRAVPGRVGSDEDLMSWIEAPSTPLPTDRFTRRPSLEPENGELLIKMRPSTGTTAEASAPQEGSQQSSRGVSLVLSAKRRTPVRPLQSGVESIDFGDLLVRPPSREVHATQEPASRAARPGSALRFPGSILSTYHRDTRPASGENRPGTGGSGGESVTQRSLDTAREYVRPSSAARSGRTLVRPSSRPSSARLRPGSTEANSHSGAGPATQLDVDPLRGLGPGGPAYSRSNPWASGRGGAVEILVNEDGESSPEQKSSGSHDNTMESPDDFYCTRKSVGGISDHDGNFSRAASRQARLRCDNEDLSAVLQEGRKFVRPLSGSHSKRSPSSEHYDTSPIAPLSAPIAMFRPTPPMTAKREMSGGMVAGIRLPPVISASPSPLQASPEDIGKALTPPSSLNTAPELERGHSFVKSSQKKMKQKQLQKSSKKSNVVDDAAACPPKTNVLRPHSPNALRPLRAQGGESEREPAPSPLNSPVGSSGRALPTRTQPTGGMRKILSSTGLSSPDNIHQRNLGHTERGPQRLGSPLHGSGSPLPRERSHRAQSPISGGLGPRQRSMNVSPMGVMASPSVRFTPFGHGAFDPSRPCLYVCQRDRRGSVLSKVTHLRGIYRSIMQAIKQAVDGDTIQVLSGTYEENLVIETNVYIKPVPGEEVTIRGDNLATINSSAMTAKFENISIEHTGGDSSLKGKQGVRCIEVHEGDLELNNCLVTCQVGSGVLLLDQAYLRVKKSRINDNGRCGIISFDESRLDCDDSQFKDNNLNGVDLQTGSNANLTRCTIIRNGQTGLLVSDHDTFVTAVDCSLSENDRRGVTAQHQGTFHLRGCTISNNRDLGVLLLGDSSPCMCLFVNCNITGNSEGAIQIHGATTIQCAWRCNRARHGIRLQVQVYLTRIAEEAAAAEAQRMELERQNSPCRSSPERDSSPDNIAEGRPERFEGMQALEADVLDTFSRFDKLGHAMNALLAQAGQ